MDSHSIRGIQVLATIAVLSISTGCSDRGAPPTAANRDASTSRALQAPAQPQLALAAADLVPFTYRAPLDPFRIQQNPEFMMQQRVRADLVVQRNVFQPGAGPWHEHPGISFVYVLDGQIQLEEFSEKTGCTTTQAYGPGQAYFEEGGHVHRAIVLSSTPAVLLVTRFNIPVGAAITTPVPAPC